MLSFSKTVQVIGANSRGYFKNHFVARDMTFANICDLLFTFNYFNIHSFNICSFTPNVVKYIHFSL